MPTPTFIFIDFQLSQEFFLICFAEKQNNVEGNRFRKKRFYIVGVLTVLKRFCSAGTFFLLVIVSLHFQWDGNAI